MLQIEPIKLLKGSHADIGRTGHGCFMNVIAYLNGEPQITDKSTCVCVTVKPIAIWLNDYMTDAERQQLLPFIERAMGSATGDIDVLIRRARLCAEYAQRRAAMAASVASVASAASAASAESAESVAMAAMDASAESAESAESVAKAASADGTEFAASAAWAAMDASAAWAAMAEKAAKAASVSSVASAASAENAALAASYFDYAALRRDLIADTIKLLDDMLPPATPLQQVHIERAEKLIALCS